MHFQLMIPGGNCKSREVCKYNVSIDISFLFIPQGFPEQILKTSLLMIR